MGYLMDAVCHPEILKESQSPELTPHSDHVTVVHEKQENKRMDENGNDYFRFLLYCDTGE